MAMLAFAIFIPVGVIVVIRVIRDAIAVVVIVVRKIQAVAVCVFILGIFDAVTVDVAVLAIFNPVTVNIVVGPVGKAVAIDIGVVAVLNSITVDIRIVRVKLAIAVDVILFGNQSKNSADADVAPCSHTNEHSTDCDAAIFLKHLTATWFHFAAFGSKAACPQKTGSRIIQRARIIRTTTAIQRIVVTRAARLARGRQRRLAGCGCKTGK